MGIVDERVHGEVVIIAALLNDLLDPCQGEIVSGVHHSGDRVCHFAVGIRESSALHRLCAVQAENTVGDNGRQRGDQDHEKNEQETYADQDLVERVPHRPGGRGDRAPGAACGRTLGDTCHSLSGFDSTADGCASPARSGFRTDYRSLLCRLLPGLPCGFGQVGSGVCIVIRTVAELALVRFCH